MPSSDSACRCALCQRMTPKVTRHHLVPQSRSRKRKRRKQVDHNVDASTEIVNGVARPAADQVIGLCCACHGMIHATFTEKEVEREFHTLESLRDHPAMSRFLTGVRRQDPSRRVAVRWTRNRRDH